MWKMSSGGSASLRPSPDPAQSVVEEDSTAEVVFVIVVEVLDALGCLRALFIPQRSVSTSRSGIQTIWKNE
jgi:hypothetical protein